MRLSAAGTQWVSCRHQSPIASSEAGKGVRIKISLLYSLLNIKERDHLNWKKLKYHFWQVFSLLDLWGPQKENQFSHRKFKSYFFLVAGGGGGGVHLRLVSKFKMQLHFSLKFFFVDFFMPRALCFYL